MRTITRHTDATRPAAWAVLVLALGGLTGCGGPELGTVTGVVTYRGEPVATGQVSFLGADGVPVCGEIDPDGTYRATGVPVGEAVVTVVLTPPREPPGATERRVTGKTKDGRPILKPKADPARRPKAPVTTPVGAKKYADTRTSSLRLTVRPGVNPFDIKLE
jgi:hypothetical protein